MRCYVYSQSYRVSLLFSCHTVYGTVTVEVTATDPSDASATITVIITVSDFIPLTDEDHVCVAGGAVADASNTGLLSDCETLLDARDTLAGSAALNWSEETPITQWEGITLRGTLERVAWLNIRGGGLDGSLPAALGGLSSLTYLNLRSNDLSGEIPTELSNLSDLLQLHLRTNQLSGTIPVELGNLSNPQRLWIHQNQLSGTIPTDLGNLANLEILNLRANGLTGSIPAELGSLSKLKDLLLHDNELEWIDPG